MATRTTPLLTAHQVHLITFSTFILLVVFGVFFFQNRILPIENGFPKTPQDFLAFYSASSLTIDGKVAAIYDAEKFIAYEKKLIPSTNGIPWFYPPTYLFMTLPLALTDYVTSQLIFFCAGLLLFLIASHIWLRWPGGLFAAAAFAPVLLNLTYGQNGLFTASFILFALYYMHRRPWLAGLFISMLVIKPHLGILIPIALVLGRYFRVFVWASLFSLLWITLSWLHFGIDSWHAFISRLAAASEHLHDGKLMLNNMISLLANMRQLGIQSEAALVLHVLYTIPFIAVMITVWLKSNSPALQGASLGLATLAFSPYLFDYDLTWQALPIGLLAIHASQTSWLKGESSLLSLAWSLPLIDQILTLAGSNEWFPYSLWPVMNLALLLLLYRRQRLHQQLLT